MKRLRKKSILDAQPLKGVLENWVFPPGLRSFFPLFPALKRWAKLVRPSGAEFSSSSFHRIAKTPVLTHTLKRWAKLVRPSGAVFSSSSFHRIAKTPVLTHTLKRWAKLVRPSGAGFSSSSFHRIAQKPVLTHTLKGLRKESILDA